MAKTKLIPGFRFHPTEFELVKYYLKRKVMGKKFPIQVIAEVDVYKYSPWDLPEKSIMSSEDLEWYFFCPVAKKYSYGSRMNRSTEDGYWKATGRDRPILHNSQYIGMMKVLVFHLGRSPKGHRTDWVMHEFRLHNNKDLSDKGIAQESYVLCRVFKKDGRGRRNNGKVFEDENWDDEEDSISVNITNHHEQPLIILPSVVMNRDDVSQIAFDEDDVSCSLDCFTQQEDHSIFSLNRHNTTKMDGANSEEKKESEGIPLDDVFGDLESLNNLAALLDEDYHGFSQVGFPTKPAHFHC